MKRGDYIEHLKSVLCFDTITEQSLDVTDRYWLHREIINNSGDIMKDAKVRDASYAIVEISKLIIKTEWTRPELRYNSDRVLEVYNLGWITFKPEDYV